MSDCKVKQCADEIRKNDPRYGKDSIVPVLIWCDCPKCSPEIE